MVMERGEPPVSVELVNTVLAARRFYLDGVSKSDIAEELGISRFKVSRLLESARKDGIVRITIDVPAEVDVDLSARVASTFGIRKALVVKVLDPSEEFTRLQLGRAGAAVLASSLGPKDVLGLSWGHTLQALVGALEGLPPCAVVQIVGGVPANLNINSMELVRQVAERAGGDVYALHVPLLLDTPAAAAAIRSEYHVRRTVEKFAHLTKAVVGVGAWDVDRSALRSALPPDLAERARRAGAVADICMTMLGEDGRPIALEELNSRLIAIRLDELAKVPEVIAIAGGAAKAPAVKAACRSGVVHHLITDESCARAMIG